MLISFRSDHPVPTRLRAECTSHG